jgi:cytoskeleton protein RodZ
MGVLWWQNHQARQEAATMTEQPSAQLNQDNSQGQPIPLGDNADSTLTVDDMSSASATMLAPAEQTPAATSASQPNVTENGLPIDDVQTVKSAGADPQAVTFTLKADCWFQIDDASGKALFSGVKRGGETFSVKGTAPYKLKIGAPGAIDIQFQGRSVDLSHFIKSSRVARLTLAAE